MIVFETRMQELVDMLPLIDGFTPRFYPVKDAKDVNSFLVLNTMPYPVIFLVFPKVKTEYKDEGVYNEATADCLFILATPELNESLLNDQRLASSYLNILNPLLDNFTEALENSSISVIDGVLDVERVPNYSDAEKNAQIDKWDAIELRATVTINNNCLNTMIWE